MGRTDVKTDRHCDTVSFCWSQKKLMGVCFIPPRSACAGTIFIEVACVVPIHYKMRKSNCDWSLDSKYTRFFQYLPEIYKKKRESPTLLSQCLDLLMLTLG